MWTSALLGDETKAVRVRETRRLTAPLANNEISLGSTL